MVARPLEREVREQSTISFIAPPSRNVIVNRAPMPKAEGIEFAEILAVGLAIGALRLG
jgi:hypothetical protein